MMRYLCSLFVLMVAFSFYSCDGNRIYKETFPVVRKISIDTISFDEIIKVGGIHLLDSFLILRDVQNNVNDFFYVYSISSKEFLYSFCTKGNGPDEFLMPTVIKNMPNNMFAIRDHGTDIITTYEITDSVAIVVDKYHFPPQDGRFCWEINFVDNNRFLLKRNNARISTRELWNIKDEKRLDSIPNTFDLVKEMGRDYHIEFDDCWISVSDTCFAFAYYFIGRIEYGRIFGDSIVVDGFVGVNESPDFYLFKETSRSNGKYKYNVDYNLVYYEDLYVDSEHIFALYSGKPWGDTEIVHSSIMEIYSLSGEPLEQFDLDKSLASFVVDSRNRCVYGINPEKYEGAILSFKY